MEKTYTLNAAAAIIDKLYGKMNLDVKGTPSRTVFTVNGKPVAQYKESNGHLSFYPYGLELQKARGARTIARWNGMYADPLGNLG